jgi:hypothetical protein
MKFITAITIIAILAVAINAQDHGRKISLHGSVSDEMNATIINATLVLDDGQGHTFTTQTNQQGRYQFTSVLPGKYNLSVVAEGFSTFTTESTITIPFQEPFNITLKIELHEQVEVKDMNEGVSVEPDGNLSATVLTEKDLENLPDDPEELLEVLRNMAGITGDAAIDIDGFDDGQLPPKSAIQSIRINSNPFSVERSGSARNRIEIITKPGSDKFHSGFSFNFNDESLNARNAFAPNRPSMQRRNYDFYLSGPVIPNKWGFFFNVERRDRDGNDEIFATILNPSTLQPQPFFTTIPTPSRDSQLSFRTNFMATPTNRVSLNYIRSKSEDLNSGINSNLDLPERIANHSSQRDSLRFNVTTTVSERAVNEIRFGVDYDRSRAAALNQSPAINVFDYFNAGGNQGSLFNDEKSVNFEFNDTVTYSYKNHTIRAGVEVERDGMRSLNRANFGGTFTFGSDFERDAAGNIVYDANGNPINISPLEHYKRTLLGLPGYYPSQFSIVQGDPQLRFSTWEAEWFLQDDWRISPRLTLSYGVRHEMQSHLSDKVNFAPRVGVAWSPQKERKSTIRAGIGIFHNYLSNNVFLNPIRFDGERQRNLVIRQPLFFHNIPTVFDQAIVRLPTIRTKAERLNEPYTIMGNVSYERRLPWNMFGAVTYTWERGVHLLLTRNINAPLPVTRIKPFPDKGPILQYETSGISNGHELQLRISSNQSRRFSLSGSYTFNSTYSNAGSSLPANAYNLSNEYARVDQPRHQVSLYGTVQMPTGIRLTPTISAQSGRPFNITTGRDNNGDTHFTDRPAFADPSDPNAIVTRFGTFNPNPGPEDRIIPRNLGTGPSRFYFDLRLSKTFGFGSSEGSSHSQSEGGNRSGRGDNEGRRDRGFSRGGGGGGRYRRGGGASNARYRLTFSIDVNNILNRTNLSGYNGVLTSSRFGRSNRAENPRRIQLGLRFNF